MPEETKKKTSTQAAAKKAPAKKSAAPKKEAAKKASASTKAKSTKAAPKKTAAKKPAAAKVSKKATSPKKASKADLTSRATAKYVRVSPRKARLVVDKIRNKSVVRALEELAFVERACALDVEKVIRSAAANAYLEKGFRPESLVITQAFVDEGPTIKRFRPRAKGAASRINKRTCHITVSVAARKEA